MTSVNGYSFFTLPPPSTRPTLGSFGLAGVPIMIGPCAMAISGPAKGPVALAPLFDFAQSRHAAE